MQQKTLITEVTELEAGDTIHMQGNGMDVTSDVTEVSESARDGRLQAWIETENATYCLKKRRESSLLSGDRLCVGGHGTVKVTRA